MTLVLWQRGLAGFEVEVADAAGCDAEGVATSDSTSVLVSLDKGVGVMVTEQVLVLHHWVSLALSNPE